MKHAIATLTIALTACLIAPAAGQPFGPSLADTGISSARLTTAAPLLSAAAVAGFWKGAYADTTRGLYASTSRFEVRFSADGRFESRQASRSPSLYDDSSLERKDEWKGFWKIQGDAIVLKIESCAESSPASGLEFCGYLQDADSVTIIAAALLKNNAHKPVLPKFTFYSLFAGQAHGRTLGAPRPQDLSWALGLGDSDKLYPDPEVEVAYNGSRSHHGAADGLIARSNMH